MTWGRLRARSFHSLSRPGFPSYIGLLGLVFSSIMRAIGRVERGCMSFRTGPGGKGVYGEEQNTSGGCDQPPPPGLLAGADKFNRGEFFECHETLEELWMRESRPIRKLYQGILQIGVAFYHLRAGRYRPVVFLLGRASDYLQPFAPACMGVDVSHLLDGAARCLAQVKRLGPGGLKRFDWSMVPRVEITN